jgi:antirestriction protein ArdC
METSTMTRSPRHASAYSRPPSDRTSLYEDITNKIIGELEAGRMPWVQPWDSSTVRAPLGMPKNAATGRTYSGINVLILWHAVVERGFTIQSWLTYKQAGTGRARARGRARDNDRLCRSLHP